MATAQPLSNVTSVALNDFNRMPPYSTHYDTHYDAASCHIYETSPSVPVYAPSTSSPYEQFVDVGHGQSRAELEALQQQIRMYQQHHFATPQSAAYAGTIHAAVACGVYSTPAYSPALRMESVPHSHLGEYYGGSYSGGHPSQLDMILSQTADVPTVQPCECIYCAPPHADDICRTDVAGQQVTQHQQHQQEASTIEGAVDVTGNAMEHCSTRLCGVRAGMAAHKRSRKPAGAEKAVTPAAASVERRRHSAASAPEGTPKRPTRQHEAGSSAKRGGRRQPHEQHQQRDSAHATPPRGREPTHHVLVLEGQFGRQFRVRTSFAAAMGAHVVFEGDRGVDIGRVTAIRDPSDRLERLPHAIREASAAEVADWDRLASDGEAAAEVAARVAGGLGLALEVVGAVFQMDRNKLTIIYDSSVRVDFRRLLPEMYNIYHCRIWMQRADEL